MTIQNAPVLSRKELAPGIFDYLVSCPELAAQAVPGQFVHIRVPGRTLRRPISICSIDTAAGTLRLVMEVRGEGTAILSQVDEGDTLDLLGPLGNGFSLPDPSAKVIVVGGGIGVPPLLGVAQRFGANADACLGFRTAGAMILGEDFSAAGIRVRVATDDGSIGHHGLVTALVKERLEEGPAHLICACGPGPMLRAVAALAKEYAVPCQVSLEERMACGVGACLGCAVQVASADGSVVYKHVCKDGPVFPAGEVLL